jgi:hypothetical protein
VEGQRDLHRALDLGDSVDLKPLLRLPLDHALQHPVHVADRGREDVDPGRLDELFRLLRRGQALGQVGRFVMDLGPGADIADLALDQDRGIDGFQRFNRLFRLGDVLFERQRGEVEDDGVEARFGDVERMRQRMGCGPR